MDELENKTIGGLKKKIKETIPQCKDFPNDKILLFYNKAMITSAEESKLEDDSIKINDESVVYIVAVSSNVAKSASSESKKTAGSPNVSSSQQSSFNQMNNSSFNGSQFGGMPNMFQQGNGSMNNMFGNNNEMLDKIMNNPAMVNSMLENMSSFVPPEQRQAYNYTLEMFKNNPEAFKKTMQATLQNTNPEMMRNMMESMGGQGGFPMMPNMSPNTMQNMNNMSPNTMNNMNNMSPNTMNNMGGSNFGTPRMNNVNYAELLQQLQNMSCPPEGPCCHGFYPLKDVNGKKEAQNPEDVYSNQLANLNEMGFPDKEANLKALVQSKGDVSEAIEILTKSSK